MVEVTASWSEKLITFSTGASRFVLGDGSSDDVSSGVDFMKPFRTKFTVKT
jgi:hypothetical protein